MPHDNLYPLLDLLHREGHLAGLGHRYHLLRAVRNTFLKTVNTPCHGNR